VDAALTKRAGETPAHQRLKRGALLWAQAQGFTACATEVTLPNCRYRADLVGYRPDAGRGLTAVFECKQTRSDLRRDNCCSATTRTRLETVFRRRRILEKHLRVHYPSLRISDSLFPEFDAHDFRAIGHQNYARVLRELNALQRRLYDCTKFEQLMRYGCANLFFLVFTEDAFDEHEVPVGWGALVESADVLRMMQKPLWHEITDRRALLLLQRVACAGTRQLNRQLGISHHEVMSLRARELPQLVGLSTVPQSHG
jgi:hypothetical protein